MGKSDQSTAYLVPSGKLIPKYGVVGREGRKWEMVAENSQKNPSEGNHGRVIPFCSYFIDSNQLRFDRVRTKFAPTRAVFQAIPPSMNRLASDA